MLMFLFPYIKALIILGCIYGLIRFFYIYYQYIKELNSSNFNMVYTYMRYHIDNTAKLPKFTFKQFLQFYKLNPKQWEFYNNDKHDNYFYLKIRTCPARVEEIQTKYGGSRYSYYPIFFTNMFEYRKYLKWAKKELKYILDMENNKAQNEATKKIVELVNGDIEQARADMEKALKETEQTLTDVLPRIKQERVNELRYYGDWK